MQNNINQLNSIIQSLASYDREQKKIIADLLGEINVRRQREQYLVDHVKTTQVCAKGRIDGVLSTPEHTLKQQYTIASNVLQTLAEKRTLQYPTLSPADHQVWLRRNDVNSS